MVFPEPLGPRKPITSPGATRKLRSSTASVSPKRLQRACGLDHGAAETAAGPAAREPGARAAPACAAGRRAAPGCSAHSARRARSVSAATSAPNSASMTSTGRERCRPG